MNYSVVWSTLVSRVRIISAWKSSVYQASRRDEGWSHSRTERERERQRDGSRGLERKGKREKSLRQMHTRALFSR